MNLKYYYWYFESAIPEKICDDIVAYGIDQQKETALIGNVKNGHQLSAKKLKNIQKKRKSDVVWMSENWIYKEIHPYINIANRNSGWNFHWDWSQACQFTEYKKDQFYDWHCDSYLEPYNDLKNQNEFGKIRKLSMTLSLTNPDDYQGGNLEFDFRDTEQGCQPRICKEIRRKGSIIVFPSFVWHRVTPVTKGVRHSLVCWNIGKPFV